LLANLGQLGGDFMDAIIKISAATKTTGDGMAACFGLSRQRIVQLANEGVLVRDEKSKYPVAENIKLYLAHKAGGKGAVSLDDERALHEQTKRKLAELELAKKLGTVHEAKDIELMVGGMITVFKRRMLSIPHKMALVLANQSQSAEEINEILTNGIDRALTELANFDVSRIAAQVDPDEPEDT